MHVITSFDSHVILSHGPYFHMILSPNSFIFTIVSFDSWFSWSIFSHIIHSPSSFLFICFFRTIYLLSFVMLGVVQWLRHWISVWKVVDSNPVTIGPLSKALNPQLSSLVNEINASFIYSYVILYTDLFSQVILSWFMSLWFLTMH